MNSSMAAHFQTAAITDELFSSQAGFATFDRENCSQCLELMSV